jgi:hypothetical protein
MKRAGTPKNGGSVADKENISLSSPEPPHRLWAHTPYQPKSLGNYFFSGKRAVA